MASKKPICPLCQKETTKGHYACHNIKAAVAHTAKGEKKRRPVEQYRQMAAKRWAKIGPK